MLPDSKTGAKIIYLGGAAVSLLKALPHVDKNPYVIAGKNKGAHLTDLQHPWQRIRKAAGLDDVRIHDLRHTFASGGLLVGEGLPMIGKLLGHTQVQTTARYAHIADAPVKAAATRIANRLAAELGQWIAPVAAKKPVAHKIKCVAHDSGALRTKDLKRVTVGTTVQPKAIAFPIDAKLLHAAIKGLNRLAEVHPASTGHRH